MAITFQNVYLKWIMAVSCVIVIYSLSYFYYSMSTSDSLFFRGLTENFIRTSNLNASQGIHNYYQWPSFFLLGSITTMVSGLKLSIYEFLLFTVIGFLLSTALYVYATKAFSRSGFLMVSAFFVVMFLYFNYQAVPFSIAFALLLILYASTVITHAFVPLFFVIYLLIRSIIDKSKKYFEFFMLTLVIYMIVQTTFAIFSFGGSLIMAFSSPSDLPTVVGNSIAPTSAAIDALPHLFSRTITIAFGILCIAGFGFLIFRRKLRKIDKAIFLTGAVYLGLGVALSVLGSRAIALAFIPIALGLEYLFATKFRKYLKYIVIVLLVFVVFIPMHQSISSFPITFQTKEDLITANFMIEKYDWTSRSIIITDEVGIWYILPQIQGNTQVDTDLGPTIKLSNITNYDCIMYSVGLANTLKNNNIPLQETSNHITSQFDLVYNSGLSYIAKKNS